MQRLSEYLSCVGLSLTWTDLLRRHVESPTRSLVHLTSQMQTSFDAMREAVLVTDGDGYIVQVNRRFNEFFGVGVKPGDKFDTISPELRPGQPTGSILKRAVRGTGIGASSAFAFLANPSWAMLVMTARY